MSVEQLSQLAIGSLVVVSAFWLARAGIQHGAQLARMFIGEYAKAEREKAETIRDGFSALAQGQAEHGAQLAAIEARLDERRPSQGGRMLHLPTVKK